MRRSQRRRRRALALNVAGLGAAAVLFIFAMQVGAPAELARSAANSLAAASVAISAGVASNPDNTLAQQLAAQKAQLAQQEAQLARQKQAPQAPDPFGLYSLIASIALLLLVGLNFYFDWRRGRGRSGNNSGTLRVDLRPQR